MNEIKENLIQIATNTVQESGISALTMRELGEAVGIKSSSVMYHFKSKDGLLLELVNSYNSTFTQFLDEITRTHEQAIVRLLKLVDILESILKEGKFCLCGMLASQSTSLDLETKETIRKFFQASQQWVATTLNHRDDADVLAMVVISSLEGAMLLDKLDEQTQRIEAVRTWVKSLF